MRRAMPTSHGASSGKLPNWARTTRCARPKDTYVATLIKQKTKVSLTISRGAIIGKNRGPSAAFKSVRRDAPVIKATPSAPMASGLWNRKVRAMWRRCAAVSARRPAAGSATTSR
jgi:hypothetical protein